MTEYRSRQLLSPQPIASHTSLPLRECACGPWNTVYDRLWRYSNMTVLQYNRYTLLASKRLGTLPSSSKCKFSTRPVPTYTYSSYCHPAIGFPVCCAGRKWHRAMPCDTKPKDDARVEVVQWKIPEHVTSVSRACQSIWFFNVASSVTLARVRSCHLMICSGLLWRYSGTDIAAQKDTGRTHKP